MLAPGLLAILGWQRRWVAEDAFISLRVVQHLLAGNGPIFNPGERVEAYSHPLWIAVLSLLAAPFAAFQAPHSTALPLEWIAAIAGLVCAVSGLLTAEMGSLRIARAAGRDGLPLPLGSLVIAALPPFWDFATSGLETGLALGWLGLCFHLAAPGPPGSPAGLAVLVGLGPLIRPDLAVVAGGFWLALLASRPDRAVPLTARALALPAVYQVFRMGFFGAALPNPALVKEAAVARWSQGVAYAVDFVGPYHLWIPATVALVAWAALLVALRRRASSASTLTLAMPACGALHALYVIRVGGDFMHGRLLLPSLFATLLPVAVVASRRRWQAALIALPIAVWALPCAFWLRPPYARDAGPDPLDSIGPVGIGDERGFYVRFSRRENPVSVSDYREASWTQDGYTLRRLAAERRLFLPWRGSPITEALADALPLAPEVPARIVAVHRNVGLSGYAAGGDVHLVDQLGLADPIASRLRLEERGRPGHEKELPESWAVARFVPAGAGDAPGEADARAALACGDVAALRGAISDPLTVARFRRNLALAWRLTRLRIPADPVAARRELCPPWGARLGP